MHRFGRLLFLGLGCIYAPSPAASQVTGDAAIHMLRPLGLIESQAMDFGRLTSSSTPGTVLLNPVTDARTAAGGVTLLSGGGEAAEFLGVATTFRLVSFSYPTTITLTRQGGTETMDVTNVTPAPGWFNFGAGFMLRFTGANTVIPARLGGTLQVGADQAAGIYTGTYNVTLNYF